MKQTKKLGLKREAIRQLTVSELRAAGGAPQQLVDTKDQDTVVLTTW